MLSRRQLLSAGALLPSSLGATACRDREALREPGPERAQGLAANTARRVREVAQLAESQPTVEGAGVHLRRCLGGRAVPLLDPFLMLDEFRSETPEDYIKGFPSHPHRGFETVTYMIDGAMEHRDSLGNHGRLAPGSVQWMTAGRGIIHSEMPKQDRGPMWGYQLWVNLPAREKMRKPRYQDLAPERITMTTVGDASARLVAGEIGGAKGPVVDIATAPLMVDLALKKGGLELPIPASYNAFVYVIEGAARFGSSRPVPRGQLVVLGPGDVLRASTDDAARFLLFAGKPIGEPIARRGPFVMNTDEELQQAFDDYRSGRLVQEG